MSSITISGDTSGAVSIAAPAIAGTNTMTLAAGTGTLAPKVLSTAVASTSGTAIDFTNIPSWVTRITVMLNAVSTNGSSALQVQLGSGSVTTSGYVGAYVVGSTANVFSGTSGIIAGLGGNDTSSASRYGQFIITNLTGNTWVATAIVTLTSQTSLAQGSITLSGTLDRVRITSVSADTFDAGTINILYE